MAQSLTIYVPSTVRSSDILDLSQILALFNKINGHFHTCSLIVHILYKTYLLMRWLRPDTLAVVRPTGVYLLNFFCSCIQFDLLWSPYLCCISFLYLDVYVLGDDELIS